MNLQPALPNALFARKQAHTERTQGDFDPKTIFVYPDRRARAPVVAPCLHADIFQVVKVALMSRLECKRSAKATFGTQTGAADAAATAVSPGKPYARGVTNGIASLGCSLHFFAYANKSRKEGTVNSLCPVVVALLQVPGALLKLQIPARAQRERIIGYLPSLLERRGCFYMKSGQL